MTLATASLGFSATLLKDKDFAPACWGKHLLLLSLALLSCSVVVGLLCVLNRLSDFRKTQSIAGDRENWLKHHIGEDEIDDRLRRRRHETRKLGKRTWKLFSCQVGAFAVGVIVLTIALALVYSAKLF